MQKDWRQFFLTSWIWLVMPTLLSGCGVLFPATVPPPGQVQTTDHDADALAAHFSDNAIINQPAPVPVATK